MKQYNISDFAKEELTILLGSTIGGNVRLSIAHANEIARTCEGNVLYINTVQPWRILRRNVRSVLGEFEADDNNAVIAAPGKSVYYFHCPLGELGEKQYQILDFVRYNNVRTIIVNSWEFAAKNYLHRERLVYAMQNLLDGDVSLPSDIALSILIYAQAPKTIPEAEKAHSGKLGKLAALATRIIDNTPVKSEEQSEVRGPMSEVGEESMVDSRLSMVGEEEVAEKLPPAPVIQKGYFASNRPAVRSEKWAPVLKSQLNEKKEVVGASDLEEEVGRKKAYLG